MLELGALRARGLASPPPRDNEHEAKHEKVGDGEPAQAMTSPVSSSGSVRSWLRGIDKTFAADYESLFMSAGASSLSIIRCFDEGSVEVLMASLSTAPFAKPVPLYLIEREVRRLAKLPAAAKLSSAAAATAATAAAEAGDEKDSTGAERREARAYSHPLVQVHRTLRICGLARDFTLCGLLKVALPIAAFCVLIGLVVGVITDIYLFDALLYHTPMLTLYGCLVGFLVVLRLAVLVVVHRHRTKPICGVAPRHVVICGRVRRNRGRAGRCQRGCVHRSKTTGKLRPREFTFIHLGQLVRIVLFAIFFALVIEATKDLTFLEPSYEPSAAFRFREGIVDMLEEEFNAADPDARGGESLFKTLEEIASMDELQAYMKGPFYDKFLTCANSIQAMVGDESCIIGDREQYRLKENRVRFTTKQVREVQCQSIVPGEDVNEHPDKRPGCVAPFSSSHYEDPNATLVGGATSACGAGLATTPSRTTFTNFNGVNLTRPPVVGLRAVYGAGGASFDFPVTLVDVIGMIPEYEPPAGCRVISVGDPAPVSGYFWPKKYYTTVSEASLNTRKGLTTLFKAGDTINNTVTFEQSGYLCDSPLPLTADNSGSATGSSSGGGGGGESNVSSSSNSPSSPAGAACSDASDADLAAQTGGQLPSCAKVVEWNQCSAHDHLRLVLCPVSCGECGGGGGRRLASSAAAGHVDIGTCVDTEPDVLMKFAGPQVTSCAVAPCDVSEFQAACPVTCNACPVVTNVTGLNASGVPEGVPGDCVYLRAGERTVFENGGAYPAVVLSGWLTSQYLIKWIGMRAGALVSVPIVNCPAGHPREGTVVGLDTCTAQLQEQCKPAAVCMGLDKCVGGSRQWPENDPCQLASQCAACYPPCPRPDTFKNYSRSGLVDWVMALSLERDKLLTQQGDTEQSWIDAHAHATASHGTVDLKQLHAGTMDCLLTNDGTGLLKPTRTRAIVVEFEVLARYTQMIDRPSLPEIERLEQPPPLEATVQLLFESNPAGVIYPSYSIWLHRSSRMSCLLEFFSPPWLWPSGNCTTKGCSLANTLGLKTSLWKDRQSGCVPWFWMRTDRVTSSQVLLAAAQTGTSAEALGAAAVQARVAQEHADVLRALAEASVRDGSKRFQFDRETANATPQVSGAAQDTPRFRYRMGLPAVSENHNVLLAALSFVMYYGIMEVNEAMNVGVGTYLSSGWNYIQLLSCALLSAAYVLRILSMSATPHYNESTDPAAGMLMREYASRAQKCAAAVTGLCWIRLVHFLSFFDHLRVLGETVTFAAGEAGFFLAICACYVLAFSMSMYFVVGDTVEGYSSYTTAVVTSIRALLGDFDYDTLAAADPDMGPIIGIVFMLFSLFFLVTVFVAIVTDSFEASAERFRNRQPPGNYDDNEDEI